MASRLVVLVTGCSSGGIGFALCEEFAKHECKVYATSRRVETMQGFTSPNIRTRALDVTNDEQVNAVVQEIYRAEGKIDIVVNNAGRPAFGPLIDQTLDSIKHTYDTNVFSVVRVCKAVIPIMAKKHSGLIINTGSIGGETPTPWHGAYSSSKAALQNISEVLTMECRPLGISIMHLSPGSVTSNLSRNQGPEFRLPEDTLYASFLPNILERLYASQTKKSMSSEEFASQVVKKALSRNPPTYLSLGGHAFTFQIFKWLPRAWVLSLLWRLYSKKKTVQ
ncbi:oxidoreductase [Hymenopellis radicata]|nr:oxidoreductase [Hymenopellis radicata]